MRLSGPLRRLLVFSLTVGMSGCVFQKDPPDPAQKPPGMLSKLGGWFGRGKKKDKDGRSEKNAADAKLPEPRRMPVGAVHLVHAEAGFVLIRTSRNTRIPPDADLITYDQAGRPTAKLRVSPERKGAFLVADIIEGQPGADDRVVMFGYVDEGGQTRFDLTDPGADEVLE